jgi:multisubunit Na+/H+ antiporter MnhF subunit
MPVFGSLSNVQSYLPEALVIAVLGFVESIVVAKLYSNK